MYYAKRKRKKAREKKVAQPPRNETEKKKERKKIHVQFTRQSINVSLLIIQCRVEANIEQVNVKKNLPPSPHHVTFSYLTSSTTCSHHVLPSEVRHRRHKRNRPILNSSRARPLPQNSPRLGQKCLLLSRDCSRRRGAMQWSSSPTGDEGSEELRHCGFRCGAWGRDGRCVEHLMVGAERR